MVQAVRLDVLIYAHDGRGLGHASRSIGVGMALRRLYPDLKVLFVSGCNLSQQLIGAAPLDWLKLPSYETKVENGKSVGIPGKSLFTDQQLGRFRAGELAHLVSLYRPRLVLVDHTPQGKHKELVQALSAGSGSDIRWVLGVRGVVGGVVQARSSLAAGLFEAHYSALLWYGDSMVLGETHCQELRQQYTIEPVECGYVLRLAEYVAWNGHLRESGELLAGTVSIPWLGEETVDFIAVLAGVLKKIPRTFGRWHLFIDMENASAAGRKIRDLFKGNDNCRLESPGSQYISSLLHSRIAVIYGGYNSLMDVMHAGIPALVVLREMQDEEQQIHLDKLKAVVKGHIATVLETTTQADELESMLLALLQPEKRASFSLNTHGAANAADYIATLLA